MLFLLFISKSVSKCLKMFKKFLKVGSKLFQNCLQVCECKVISWLFLGCFKGVAKAVYDGMWCRDQRDSRWSLSLDNFCSVSAGLGLDNHRNSQSRWVSVSTTTEFPSLYESRSRHHRISQSRWVSVSTTTKFPSLDESPSRQPQNFPVSMSLGLDNHRIYQSRWVSVSTT